MLLIYFFSIQLFSYKIIAQTLIPKKSIDGDHEVFYQGICINNEVTKMKIQCRGNEKMKILRTVYGYNPMSSIAITAEYCTFSIKDCYFDRDYTIDDECTGKNSCEITIRKSSVIKEASLHKQFCKNFNYMQINFQCLPELQIIDICELTKTKISHAYIMSPNYPSSITSGAKCDCTIKSNYKDGQILLRRIDMKIPGNTETEICNDAFLDIIENNKRSERKCGYNRETGSIFGSGANELKIMFSTSVKESWNDRGIWLEIQASPPTSNAVMEITCNKDIEDLYIHKKLKTIEDKLRNRMNKYTIKALKYSKPPNINGKPVFNGLMQKSSNKKFGKPLQVDNSNQLDDYDSIKEILDKELNEIVMDGVTRTTITIINSSTTKSITTENIVTKPITTNSVPKKTLEKSQKMLRTEGMNEWKKALGQMLNEPIDNPSKSLSETQSVGSNQYSDLNVGSGVAAQKQDLNSVNSETKSKSSTAVFIGIAVSIILVSVIINAAMCYSCYTKRNVFDRNHAFDNKDNSSTPNYNYSISNGFGKMSNLFTKVSKYIRNKFKSNEPELENYDNFYTESIAPSISTITRENKFQDAVAYSSCLESIYSGSVISESVTNLDSSFCTQQYPNLPAHDERDEDMFCHYSEYYDKFGMACTNETDNGHKFYKNPNVKQLQNNNKYTNKRDKSPNS